VGQSKCPLFRSRGGEFKVTREWDLERRKVSRSLSKNKEREYSLREREKTKFQKGDELQMEGTGGLKVPKVTNV